MSTHHSTPRPWWPYLLAALAAVGIGAFLLFGARQEVTPSHQSRSEASVAQQTRAPAPSPHASSSSPAFSARPVAASTPAPAPSVKSTSAERSQQIRVEQQAIDKAVSGLSDQQRGAAQDVAEDFIETAYGRAWDTDQVQWAKELGQLASAEVVQELNSDRDWESQQRAAFVEARAVTRVRVSDAQAQNISGDLVEVAVDFSTQTESDDPWVAVAPAQRSETVVVEISGPEPQVVERFSMDPAGGL
ncbi:hypothetical protein ACIA8I_41385 [Streptomyces rishiriensis]|uniref:hypothetical protein n=1 Tax=Streptomyces rishiriensis TaxID=68264 RepID=UPI003795DF49